MFGLKAKGVNFMGFVENIMKPFSDKKKMGIGTILLAIPLVNIIAGILLLPGYALQTAQKTMKGDKSLPEWGNWERMVKDSLKVVFASAIYLIPLAIIAAIVMGPSLIAALGTITNPSTIADTSKMTVIVMQFLGGLLVMVPIVIIYGIIMNSAIMNMAKGGFGAAFKIGEVIKKGFTVKFIVAMIKAFVAVLIIAIILVVIAVALALVPFVGFILAWLASGLMSYAVSVTQYSILAEGYK